MISNGLYMYKVSLLINLGLSIIFVFINPSISCGILLSTVIYFIYLWTLTYGITKAFNDGDKNSVIMVLVLNTILFGLLILVGFIFSEVFSLIGILFGVFLCKILYVIGVMKE